MTQQDLVRDMKQFVGGGSFITTTELAAYMGQTNHHRVKQKYCQGIDRVGKAWFIPDVCRNIRSART